MAEEFRMEIPVDIRGIGVSEKQEGYEGEIVKQQSSILSTLGKIAVFTGISALIWKGLEPILTPLLKLISLLALVLFLPLMPYIKQMAERLAEMVEGVKEGQTGETPLDQFVGGIGAFISDNFWIVVGGIIGGALIASLSSKQGVGALVGLLTLKFTLDKILGAETLGDAFKGTAFAFLGSALTALLLGAGKETVKIGTLTAAATLALSLAGLALKEEDLGLAVAQMVGASAVMALVGERVLALLLGAGTVSAIPLGVIAFAILAELRWGWLGKTVDWVAEQWKSIQEIPNRISTGEYSLIESIFGKEEKGTDIVADLNLGILATRDEIKRLQAQGDISLPIIRNNFTEMNNTIGNVANNASLITSVMNTSQEMTNMANNSSLQIGVIIQNLARIPRTIVTTHIIRTVRV